MANIRVLIATTSQFRDALALALAGCPVEFACTMDEGREALRRVAYTHVIIGYLFAESHMFDFALEVRSRQPDARVLCVKAAGRSLRTRVRSGLNAAAVQLGCEGFFDLSAGDRPDSFDRVFNEILTRFPLTAPEGPASSKMRATAEELRRIALG
ncbi:MAG TPA: hypothetical protein VE756_02565 [Burkholderiales bacterium]|jgi:hypothetical protein|nr:hypothetical protein [Burkholderiales bacterium]